MKPVTVDDYLAALSPKTRQVLQTVRETIQRAAPEATERLSYGMPTFFLGGVLIHIGAFKNHIGLFPPVTEPELQERVQRYRGPKGNLQLPLSEPIPHDLIADIVKARVRSRA